jgi:hypothetical protein
MAERRFPAPRKVVETPGAYRVDNATGQTLGRIYGEDEPTRRNAMKGLTMAEARRFARAFARLTDLLAKGSDQAR